jgi:hypothetical protein
LLSLPTKFINNSDEESRTALAPRQEIYVENLRDPKTFLGIWAISLRENLDRAPQRLYRTQHLSHRISRQGRDNRQNEE